MPPGLPSDAVMTDLALDLRQLHCSFGERTVLRDVALQLAAGERVAITGRSGRGKSSGSCRLWNEFESNATVVQRSLPRSLAYVILQIELGGLVVELEVAKANQLLVSALHETRIVLAVDLDALEMGIR